MNREQLIMCIGEYGREIYSFCRYLTRNKEDADDLYQQTFLIAYEKSELREQENPKSYLITIAVNVWRNHKRKYLWRKQKADILYLQSEDVASIQDDRENVLDTVVRAEELERLRRLVDELPEKMRLVILMFYMENMQVGEIADALDIPIGTVKSRLHQAKTRLKERWDRS